MNGIGSYYKKLISKVKNGSVLYTLGNTYRNHASIRYVDDPDIKVALNLEFVYKKLKHKYSYVLQSDEALLNVKEEKSNKIWTIWLQGYDNAPELSKVCISRIIDRFGAKNVTIVTMDNINDYIKIPDYILKKWRDGKISYVHLADYIQIALLAQHGGTWFDATVYIMDEVIPDYFMNSPFFVFNNYKRGTVVNISSWFMTSYKNNKIMRITQLMLEEYWKNENDVMHYLILHLFIRIITDEFQSEWKAVPNFSNIQAHTLAYEIFDKYSELRKKQIGSMCPIQKLSNKFDFPDTVDGTFYSELICKGERK